MVVPGHGGVVEEGGVSGGAGVFDEDVFCGAGGIFGVWRVC